MRACRLPLLALALALAALAACAAPAVGLSWAGGAAELVERLDGVSADLVLLQHEAAPSVPATAAAASVAAAAAPLDPARLPAACPPLARAALSLCERLATTLQAEGGLRPGAGFGESVCGISRFALDQPLLCERVYEHLAAVGQRWPLDERMRAEGPLPLCLAALAEPVESRALLSPRTERKCAGRHTAADSAADAEPDAPAGYTGNTLEDPFGSGVVYTDGNCRCECRGAQPCKGCSCSKGAAAAAAAAPSPAPAAAAAPGWSPGAKTPLAPLVPPSAAQCVKGAFRYEFPYSRFLPSAGDVHVVVDAELQRMRVYSGARVLAEYEVSTSQTGLGSEVGSLRTPSGAFRISQKAGDGVPMGGDLVGLRATGRSSGPDERSALQTRVLVLDGLDAANRNTRSRLIVVAGTNKEAALGRPASQGSIRMRNADVMNLYERVPVGARLFVVPRCAWPKEQAAVQVQGQAAAAPLATAKAAASAPTADCKSLSCMLQRVKSGMLGDTKPRPVQPARAHASATPRASIKKRSKRAAALQAQGKLRA